MLCIKKIDNLTTKIFHVTQCATCGRTILVTSCGTLRNTTPEEHNVSLAKFMYSGQDECRQVNDVPEMKAWFSEESGEYYCDGPCLAIEDLDEQNGPCIDVDDGAEYEPEPEVYEPSERTATEDDADALASAGHGDDEDYGCYDSGDAEYGPEDNY